MVSYVLYVFVVSAPFFGLHLFLSFLPSFSFFACSVLYTLYDCCKSISMCSAHKESLVLLQHTLYIHVHGKTCV